MQLKPFSSFSVKDEVPDNDQERGNEEAEGVGGNVTFKLSWSKDIRAAAAILNRADGRTSNNVFIKIPSSGS